ncbi:hypothetical protein [Streptomyces sp. PD-S100-1]|uniref:hypothetical protein n=1 Tax=Streptomyces sp. PD-S100-1 TaxID=3394351 RepID=UPI0039BCACEA
MPGGSYQTCDRELKHSGDHGYLNQWWPRPEPAEPDYDVWEILDNTAPRDAWGLQGRSFPIIVTETVTRVLWVDAETEDDALAYWEDDVPDLKGTEVLDAYLEYERPDAHQRQDALKAAGYGRKIGPQVACPDCGKESFRREWFHDPYRKCHGPIVWKTNALGRAQREYQSTPAHSTRQGVAR